MKYKISNYNYVIENKQGDILLFNSLIGKASMLKIKGKYKSMISNILDRTEYSIENPNYLESQLIKFGYLIPHEKDEEKIIKNIFENTINDKQLSLIIAPTENCNLRCVYCCEEFKENHSMSIEMQNSIIKFVEDNIDNYSSLDINWFGGEPLLAMDVIRNLSQNFIRICKSHKKRYKAFMVTNGTLLTLDIFKELYDLKVLSFQITLDCTKSIHDSQRILINHEGTFDLIVKNLEKIKDSVLGKYSKILILTNCSKSNDKESLYNYKQFFYRKFGDDKRFGFLLQCILDLGGNRVIEYKDKLFDFEGMNNIYETLGSYEQFRLNYLFDEFLNPGSQICYAARKNSYLISSYGKIYKCEHVYQINKEKFIGEFDLDGNMNIIENKELPWIGRFNFCKSTTCKLKPFCGGEDCIDYRISNSNSNLYNSCSFRLCHFKKKSLENVLKFLDVECNSFPELILT